MRAEIVSRFLAVTVTRVPAQNGTVAMIAALVFALAATVFSGRENQLRVPPPRVDTAAAR
jgi:hypothetical protein